MLVLASGSPRRAKILKGLGVAFTVVKTDAPEVCYPHDPERTVSENAKMKWQAGLSFSICRLTDLRLKCSNGPLPQFNRKSSNRLIENGNHILAADTIVWFNNRIYGKPKDLDEARAFLRELRGQTHTVFTGVAYDGDVKVVRSDVTFRDLSDAMIDDYVARVRPTDRAGAYDIDESGDLIVAGYTGSYENIMGLPVEPLREWGIVAS